MAAGFISLNIGQCSATVPFMVFDIRPLKKQQVIDTAMTTDIFTPSFMRKEPMKNPIDIPIIPPSTAAR